MHPLDKLCITDDAGTFYLECLVVGIDRQRAYIQQVSETSLVPPRNLMMRTCTSRGLGPTEDGKSSAAASRRGGACLGEGRGDDATKDACRTHWRQRRASISGRYAVDDRHRSQGRVGFPFRGAGGRGRADEGCWRWRGLITCRPWTRPAPSAAASGVR